ncbi:DMT family transporter [Achromobacter xylosoxidans]|uniref:DMT family transporter n=1 Tax=Alcaligenes xylosoxydans xylosoxydans TaxID=85698 RepID=UPI0006C31C54|nr:DMT family transporter [Achromobacter xylosoxidans]MCH4571316.1 DMT family transporter [Achromobacter xylosoxidans]MDD7990137.1 DMT family transporter [Achromobacter xylosoxidans]NEV07847.1 EamA family transporter [Achromobacter xylosoxidans]OFO57067.1 transporter [Achromobacter xylosoxidans]OMG85315.1 transporter [Achromobacter xylosoxidans]
MSRSVLYPSPQVAPAASAASSWEGYGYGLLGVVVFSLTLPMTRVAVAELPPLLVGLGRALLAAVPALALLSLTRSRRPDRREWPGVILAAIGIVVGWPLASSLAMQTVASSHGAVFNGLLPLSTAVFAAWRSGERPSPAFWGWAMVGAALVCAFALREGQGSLVMGDFWLLLAVLLGGMGYAEGARASRTLGGWRTICWALVISAPVLVAPVGWMAAQQAAWPAADVIWASAYLAFGSMFLGFFAWYRGLAAGGIARVGQIQLLQPFLTVLAATLFFGESADMVTFLFAAAVIVVIAGGRRAIVGVKK